MTAIIHYYSIMQNSFTALKITLPQLLVMNDLFTVSMVFLF